MSMNFGPLNRVGGERRLNVAITRDKYNLFLLVRFILGTSRQNVQVPKALNFSKAISILLIADL